MGIGCSIHGTWNINRGVEASSPTTIMFHGMGFHSANSFEIYRKMIQSCRRCDIILSKSLLEAFAASSPKSMETSLSALRLFLSSSEDSPPPSAFISAKFFRPRREAPWLGPKGLASAIGGPDSLGRLKHPTIPPIGSLGPKEPALVAESWAWFAF